MTKLQQAILEILKNSKDHFTAEDVFWALKPQFPKLALGTVYRNLNYFSDQKMIRRVYRADAPDFYEWNTKPHDHAVCIKCGVTSDLFVPDLKDFLKSQILCDIVSFDLNISYICPECSENNCKAEEE